LAPSLASGDSITIPYQWTVTAANGSTQEYFGVPLVPGTQISSAWSFEDTLSDLFPEPNVGIYGSDNFNFRFHVAGSGFFGGRGSGSLLVLNNVPNVNSNDFPSGAPVDELFFQFRALAFDGVYQTMDTRFTGDPLTFSSDAIPPSIAGLNGMVGRGDFAFHAPLRPSPAGCESPRACNRCRNRRPSC
jgi:hypothetical protein